MIGICIFDMPYIGIRKRKRSNYSRVQQKQMNPTFDQEECEENDEDEQEIKSKYSEFLRDDERYIPRQFLIAKPILYCQSSDEK